MKNWMQSHHPQILCCHVCYLLLWYCLFPLWEALVLSMVTLTILQTNAGLSCQTGVCTCRACSYCHRSWLVWQFVQALQEPPTRLWPSHGTIRKKHLFIVELVYDDTSVFMHMYRHSLCWFVVGAGRWRKEQ